MSSIATLFIDCLLASAKADDSEKAMLREYLDGRVKVANEKLLTSQALEVILNSLADNPVLTDLHRHVLKNLVTLLQKDAAADKHRVVLAFKRKKSPFNKKQAGEEKVPDGQKQAEGIWISSAPHLANRFAPAGIHIEHRVPGPAEMPATPVVVDTNFDGAGSSSSAPATAPVANVDRTTNPTCNTDDSGTESSMSSDLADAKRRKKRWAGKARTGEWQPDWLVEAEKRLKGKLAEGDPETLADRDAALKEQGTDGIW
ncbi:hypothetical protein F5Y04DRAFT_276503 [Hypomontagnella monticulosa]|nr:hypothetical protein F5Y04DRAFT_276503 [Hypomontagnella monticulosa]